MFSAHRLRRRGAPAVTVLCVALAAGAADAETIIVNPGGSIQGAIVAAGPGDTILVNPGTYVGNFDLLGKAVTLRSAQGPNVTHLLAPAAGGTVLRCVSQEAQGTVIQGFTIRGGFSSDGGGVLLVGASPRIEACIITDNGALNRGGGLANLGGAPSVRQCTFTLNAAAVGGGFYSRGDATFERCTLRLNRADRGGGGHAEDSTPTVTACEFTQNGGNEDSGSGAGLSLLRSDASVTECLFSGNKQVTGGGLMSEDGSPVLTRCVFAANSSESGNGGGAMLLRGAPTVQACRFENNVTNFGSGAALALQDGGALIADGEFTSNRSVNPGGASGVHVSGGAPAIVRCRLHAGEGSALAVFSGTPLIAGCLMSANQGYSGPALRLAGGAPVVASCTMGGNVSPFGMGGGASLEAGTPRLVGCTMVGNRAAYGGGLHHAGGTPVVMGTIVWACASLKGGPPIDSAGGLDLTYSCVQGGWPGAGNIDVDPMLAADPLAGYRLLAGSPCIDAASNAGFPADASDMDADGDLSERLPFDALGRPRYIDDPAVSEPAGMTPPVADMGAVEFQAAAEGCTADWNRDGSVNSFDTSEFLTAWMEGQSGGPWIADMNADGRLDSSDISSFLSRWVADAGGC